MAHEDFPERMIMEANIREFSHTRKIFQDPAHDRTKEYIRGEFS
jgi:ABC-type phosphate transport system ATPase subunit